MSGVRVGNAPGYTDRKRDISSWQEGDITCLRSRAKRRYYQYKFALKEYFTTEASIEEVALRHRLSTQTLLQMAEKCLMQHQDGKPWGFRALFPGVNVVDHTPQASETLNDDDVDTAKRQIVKLPVLPPVMEVPETPIPAFIEDEEEEPQTINVAETMVEDLPAIIPEETVEEQAGEASESVEETTVDDGEDAENGENGENGENADKIEEQDLSTEAQEAIAEAERIVAEENVGAQFIAPRSAMNYTPTHRSSTFDVEEEEKQPLAKITAPISRVTTPIRVVEEADTIPLVLRIYGKHRTYRTYNAPKKLTQGRLVRKRWQRDTFGQRKQKNFQRILSFAIVAAVLLLVLVPAGVGLAAYGAYNNLSTLAHDGVNHLLKVKTILNISKDDPTAALDAAKLKQAQIEFKAAESDFAQLQQLVSRPDVQSMINQFAPQYGSKLDMAESLVQAALDVSRMGDELSGIGLIGANILHASPLASGSTKPLISVADIEAIEASMVHALYYISDIREQMSHVSIKDLPISDAQKAQLNSVLPLLPKAEDTIKQVQGMIGMVGWLVGVGHERRFLIQTMDRAELRPGGGFTGQYGILQIQDGRMTPPTLTDVTIIDYAGNGTAIGRSAPPEYKWMNFGNWGVRDSNLSGDFPTTARMTMQLFQDEGGGPLDGDIAFTPALIAHILDVVGPIKVPGYNETITSKNLEDKLHYYQQDFSAIAREKAISGNYSHAGRKAFTATLGKLLLDRVRHLKPKQMLDVAKNAIKDIQSRDLEIYFTNPIAEAWLIAHGYAGSLDTFSQQDGFAVIQANISISKASQYVHTTEHDDITLDAQGGATHNLTITLDYQQKGPVYGYDTYADYIRVYAPKGSQFLDGNGFDTGHALCTPSTTGGTPTAGTGQPKATGCGQYSGSFPSDSRYCPDGNYSLGIRGGGSAWPVDSLGPPTAQTSDLPGRAMWGGLTETPKNCTSYITLSWYVPHAIKKVNGKPVYTILIQKQSGCVPTIELNIDASAIKGLNTFTFKGDISIDRLFTFTLVPPPHKK